jgi:trypsin
MWTNDPEMQPCMRRRHWGGAASLFVLLTALLTASAAPASASAHSARRHRVRAQAVRRSTDHRRSVRSALAHAAVIGGSPAASGTFPQLAFISDTTEEEGFFCTGTVVAANLILTAAHCAENPETGVLDEPSGYTVVTGNVDWTASPRQVSAVSKVIVYSGFLPSILDRDAALLVLATPTTAPVIPLWTASNAGTLEPGRAADIVGWGQEYFEQEALPERLKWAGTAIQSPEWCSQNAPSFYEQDELCTINPPDYRTGACHGDSGGPLLVSSAEGPVEVGITSHGSYECSTTQPTVFTRTDILIPWVHEWAEAEKPAPPVSPPITPTPKPPASPATHTRTPKTPPVVAPASAPAPPPIEGVYRGATSQLSAPISLIVGSGGHRITAVATKIVYRCRSGRTISEPLEGLSNEQAEPITASHTFSITFSGAESEDIVGSIAVANEEMSGTLSARWQTHRYGLCSTGRVSWTAQHTAPALSTVALTSAGNYHGWTNQAGHILMTVAPGGRQLTELEFSATYECPRRHSVHLTESFLTPTEPTALESFGTFTVVLAGHDYSGRVDGTFGLGTSAPAFGTLEASTVTRYGRCHTGVVPWET